MDQTSGFGQVLHRKRFVPQIDACWLRLLELKQFVAPCVLLLTIDPLPARPPVRIKELPMLPSEVMAQLFRGQKLFSGNTVPKDSGGIQMMSVFFLFLSFFLSFLVSYSLFSFTKACYSSSKSLKLGVLEESTSSPTYNPFWLSERPDNLSCRGPFWPLLS